MTEKLFYYVLLPAAFALGGGKAWLEYSLREELAAHLKRLPASFSVHYRDTAVALPAKLMLSDLHIDTPCCPPLSAERLLLHRIDKSYDEEGDVPWLHIELRGLRFSPPNWPPSPVPPIKFLGLERYYLSPKEFSALGYADLRGGFSLRLDNKARPARLEADLRIDKGLRLTLRMEAEKFNLKSPAAFLHTPLQSLSLRYQGLGLTTKAEAYLARRNAVEAADLRAELNRLLPALLKQAGIQITAADVTAFLGLDGVLEISLQPTQAFSLFQLQRLFPYQLVSQAGLKIQSSLEEEK